MTLAPSVSIRLALAFLLFAAGCGAPTVAREDVAPAPTLCTRNQHVASQACVECPAGTTNDAGDDAAGADTACEATLCLADQHVVGHGCVTCPNDTTNEAGDDASGADTTCDDDIDANHQPSLPNAVTRVAALPETRTAFSLAPEDPEGDPFTVSFKGCAKSEGVIEICKTAECLEAVVLDCAVAYTENNTPQRLDVALPITGYFTSGVVVRSFAAAQAYNTAYFVFDDDASKSAAKDTAVIFDVRIVNRAPWITVQDQNTDTSDVTVGLGSPFNPTLAIHDDDFDDLSLAQVSVVLTVDAANPLDVDGIAALVESCPETAEVSATRFAYTCYLPAVNQVLAGAAIVSPTVAPENDGLQTTITLSVSDLGQYGQCDDILTFDTTPCPLGDTLTITVTWQAP